MGAFAPRVGATSLYSDQRARAVNDIVTILVVESATADQSSDTRAGKSAAFDTQGGPGTGPLSIIPLFGVSASASNTFEGEGSTSRSGRLSATITASVKEVFPNGNLRLEGIRVVEINQEQEVLYIQGIARPRDISGDNTIYSTALADAEISYRGSGALDNASHQGILSRLLGWLF